MASNRIPIKRILAAGAVFAAIALAAYFSRAALRPVLVSHYHLFTDREAVKNWVTSFGMGAPAAFMAIQILQVVLAPIPGEVTGFIGGYLFGAASGFLLSSIALAAGSVLNFFIGRFLGRRYIRNRIPPDVLSRFDRALRHQGVIVSFVLFVVPGFPKDYLCLFLGLSTIPFKVFVLLAAVGRMPGTLLLSLQGSLVFKANYAVFGVVFGLCLLATFLIYRYREAVYRWVERLNSV